MTRFLAAIKLLFTAANTDRKDGPNARYTDRSRAAMSAANRAARAAEAPEIHPGHLLWGILSLSQSVASAALIRLGTDPAALRLCLHGQAADDLLALPDHPKLPLARSTQRVIDSAWLESGLMHDDYVGTQHLLLGVLRHGDNPAAAALHARGVELGVARAAVAAVISEADLLGRAEAHWKQGEYPAAIACYRQVVATSAPWPDVHRVLAWRLATCPDPACRDARAALEHATTAIRLAPDESWALASTLAAALAESGEFHEALRSITRALEIAPTDRKDECRAMRVAFAAGKPWRDPP